MTVTFFLRDNLSFNLSWICIIGPSSLDNWSSKVICVEIIVTSVSLSLSWISASFELASVEWPKSWANWSDTQVCGKGMFEISVTVSLTLAWLELIETEFWILMWPYFNFICLCAINSFR